MGDSQELTDLQLAVMRVLWDRGEATAAEVHEELLEERGLAPTTVATILSRLAKKEIVVYRAEGRQYVYRAGVSETSVQRSMLARVRERLFGGDVAAMVSNLLGPAELDPEEIARIRALVEAKERETRGSDDD